MRRSSQLPRTGSAYGATLSLSLSLPISPLFRCYLSTILAASIPAPLYARGSKMRNYTRARSSILPSAAQRYGARTGNETTGGQVASRNERETIGTRTTEIFCADVVFKRRSRLGLLVSTSPSEMGVSRGTKVNDYSSLGQVFETR